MVASSINPFGSDYEPDKPHINSPQPEIPTIEKELYDPTLTSTDVPTVKKSENIPTIAQSEITTTVTSTTTTTVEEPPTLSEPSTLPDTEKFATFTASNGKTSKYHIYADNIDPTKPISVIIRLHGDGGTNSVKEFDNPENLLDLVADDASELANTVVLAPLAPDTEGAITWWEERTTNAVWLTELIKEKLLVHPGISQNDLYYTGYSGGGEFLTYLYIYEYPEMVTGAVLNVAGGGGYGISSDLNKSTPKLDLPIRWKVGSIDNGSGSYDGYDALSSTQSGYEAYRQRGFTNIQRDVLPGHDHYTIDQRELIKDNLIPFIEQKNQNR